VYIGATPLGAKVRFALYTTNGSGNPGALVTQTAEGAAVAGWTTISVPAGVVLAPGNYWIIAQTNNSGTVYRYASGLGSQDYYGWRTRTYGAFPATISGWYKQWSYAYSMYGTVVP
jgi:hypothetical protein